MNSQRVSGRFIATLPDGSTHTILLIKHFTDTSDLNGRSELEIDMSLRTPQGRHVNRIAQGHYEFADSPGVPLLSSDPSAP